MQGRGRAGSGGREGCLDINGACIDVLGSLCRWTHKYTVIYTLPPNGILSMKLGIVGLAWTHTCRNGLLIQQVDLSAPEVQWVLS